jgi:arginyl-tRNA synthetase
MLEEIKTEIARLLAAAADMMADKVYPTIEQGKVGDFSSRIAFVLAKERNENPGKLAQKLAGSVKKSSSFEKIEAAGPYINFYLSDQAYAAIIAEILSKMDKYGKGEKKDGKVLIEFPSVNPNKPWHIGHLRNALIGESVARILEFDGYHVERMDYIDDLGLQVAQSLWGFLNFEPEPEGKFDVWLGRQYVGIAKMFEEEKEVVSGVRDVLKAMEEGDNEISDAGRKLAEACVKAQYETAFNFGVYHDVLVFESDIMRTIFNEGVEYLKASDAVVFEKEGKNAGCWVVKFSGEQFGKMENPDKVLIRSDGTAVYTGKDVIFHLWKFGILENKFKFAAFMQQPNGRIAYKTSSDGMPMDFGSAANAINVIGVEQRYPQHVIVEVLRSMHFGREASNLKHLSYEHVGLPEQKFSGRKGTWIGHTADDLLEEAKQRVDEKVKIDIPDDEVKEIARLVGVGAIKFSFLRTNADKRIIFSWEEALNLEGDSGPYAQYAYVRTRGIIGKSREEPSAYAIKFNEQEKILLQMLLQFRDVVSRCSKEHAPHHMTKYVLDVAADFSSFYATSPVLAAEDEKVRKTRLAITKATGIVLKNALHLLGVECPERM